ncbi:O-antigen ligase family protein [Aquabacterium parvum]|uniref:O-antigen ligase family protein n=1 Tax=Aquabacterium parvum TaxID=70584 RepID=UPI000718F67D|nr:O-antigen ligase family protein [Aquabacterium parvum]
MHQGARASLLLPVTLGALFAALMVLTTPVLTGIALVALASLLFVVSQPKRGFLLFCLLAPALPWMTISLGVRITTSEALLALTWLGVFWHWLTGTLPGIHFGPTERLVALFLGWTVVPLIVGQFIPEGDGIGPVNWVRYLLNVSPIALLPILAPTPREREQVILCLLLGFALLACISLGFFFAGRDARLMVPFLTKLQYAHPEVIADIFGADPGRMASPWVHPNSTGGAMLLAAPLGLFYGVANVGWRRALGWFVAVTSLAGIVFCGSRGALVAMGVIVIWLAFKRTPYALRGLAIAGVLAAVFVATYPPAQKRFASLFSSNDVSTGVRFEEYKRFPENALRYPLGLGFKADTPASSPEKDVYGISNLWLNYWFKLGLPGMVLFILATRAWWREVRMPGRFERVDRSNAMRIATVGTVLAALSTGFIDHYFSFTQVLIALFWLVFALGLHYARTPDAALSSSSSHPIRP